MNEETKQKMKASREANRNLFDNQTITINAKWRIIRADELNWCVQSLDTGKWRERGYFGQLSGALASLPDKMVADEPLNSLADVMGALNSIKRDIAAAF